MSVVPIVLPRIDPAVAATRSALLAALAHRTLAGDKLRVSHALAGEADAWVVCADGIAVASITTDGRRAELLADDGQPDAVAAVAALAAIEPALALLEDVLGIGIRPESLARTAPADAVVIAVASGGLRFLLAAAPGIRLRPPAPNALAMGAVRTRWRLCLPAPGLQRPPARGDLLIGILPTGTVEAAGHSLPVRLAGPQLTVIGPWRLIMHDPETATGFDPAAARLPVTVSIDGAVASIAALAQLAPGAVLPLPGDPGRIAVTVLAGGAPLASGTLVAIGDGHGVLVDQVFATPAAGTRAA